MIKFKSKIFIDTSIFLEYLKGEKKDLLDFFYENGYNLYYNDIVYSELVYLYIGNYFQKSPLTIKNRNKIKEALSENDLLVFLNNIEYLQIGYDTINLSYELMKKHNLLPNDSLVLATCKINKIEYLASYDSDFIKACAIEDIILINKITN
jgi:uncharacterized protein